MWQDRKTGEEEWWPARRSTMVIEEGDVAGQKDGQRRKVADRKDDRQEG
jgi:hypothetical protein